jgi:uncharacterized oxidoreductase
MERSQDKVKTRDISVRIHADLLKSSVQAIFAAAGCHDDEAARIAGSLVEANLVGHDSHGVIRVPLYLGWLKTGHVLANQTLKVVFENEVIAIVDGQFGFGQTMGQAAMVLGIKKGHRSGLTAVALRNPSHMGRIGEWAEMAVRDGLISLHFLGSTGAGTLVAPFGGIEGRLSANPVAVGIPMKNGPPLIWDISTSTIAEGKVRVALNKGLPVPAGCMIDAEGRPTTDPKAFYGPPRGAILPFGGHKGFGLCLISDILGGALTGNGSSGPALTRLGNGMLTVLLDPAVFLSEAEFAAEVDRLLSYVRGSKKASEDAEILMPGEIEARTRAQRSQEGIELDETTWREIQAAGREVGVTVSIPSQGSE